MTTLLTFSAVWLVFALWQSTLCLGVPLLLVHRVVKTPWRAHVLLCTGIFSAVLAPTLSTGLAFRNGGINSQSYRNFQSENGIPVTPAVYEFSTCQSEPRE
ncbi:MAG: hypothetical protein FWH27_17330 [Planctomycetaceae bacterium]|nr:hypothetical protein [Planctomycetaceae bacterium]